jgi:hypothetical protein
LGQICLDFKFDADIAKADNNKAKADINNVADKAVASNVAIKANEANEGKANKADETKHTNYANG